MGTANRLSRNGFEGADVVGVVNPWPDFEFPIEKWAFDLNPQSGAQSGINGVPINPPVNEPFIPVIDGHGQGVSTIGGGAFFTTWRLRSNFMPGESGLQVDLWAKWKNPAGAPARGAGILIRCIDARNTLVARIAPQALGANPIVRLVKVLAGVETVLGSYQGAALTNAMLQSGFTWRVRAKDLPDGSSDTEMNVYLSPHGGDSKGDERITVTADIGILRGAHAVGVELQGVANDDCPVRNLDVYDLADEGGADPGGGEWVLELDGTRYTTEDLTSYSPKIVSFEVVIGFAPDSSMVEIHAPETWVLQEGLRPGMPCKAWHGTECRFSGKLMNGNLSANPKEDQVWQAHDAFWLAGLVDIFEDNGQLGRAYNVYDKTDPLYRASRQNMSQGAVWKDIADSQMERMRKKGAFAPGKTPYVQAELDAMTAVIPNNFVGGNFQAGTLQITTALRRYQPLVDPRDGLWHFRDLSQARQREVACSVDRIKITVSPDVRRACSAVKFVGTRQSITPIKMSILSQDDATALKPLWTTPQEAASGKGKEHKGSFGGTIAGSGAEPFHGVTRCYLLLAAAYGFVEDEWRGSIAQEAGGGQFVTGNTGVVAGAIKVYLSDAAWPMGGAPAPGDPFLLTMLDPQAAAQLSSEGVGAAYYAPPIAEICGYGGGGDIQKGVATKGCTPAVVTAREVDPATGKPTGNTFKQFYEWYAVPPTSKQAAAGFCDTAIVLSNVPKPPTYWNTVPGSSPPVDQCGPLPSPVTAPNGLDVSIDIPALGPTPVVRVPTEEDTWRGPVYSDDPANWDGGGAPKGTDWGWEHEQVIPVPDFVDVATQGPGLAQAGADILSVMAEKPFLVSIEIATPWKPNPQYPVARSAEGGGDAGYSSAQWAGLDSSIVVTSARRTTNLEAVKGLKLPVYRVRFDILRNKTFLEAGTAGAWTNATAEQIAKPYLERATLIKAAGLIAQMAADLGCLLTQPPAAGQQQAGQTPGCNVQVFDSVRMTENNVQTDDEIKKSNIAHGNLLTKVLGMGAGMQDAVKPGAQLAPPGFDNKQVGDNGRILGSLARTPLSGPARDPNGGLGTYSGLQISDKALAGRPGDVLQRFANFQIQKAMDGGGSREGAYDAEVQPLDAQGAPTGGATPLRSLLDVGGAGLPMAEVAAGSYPAQLRDREDEVLRRLLVVRDAEGRVLAPGTVTADYAEGVPADLAMIAKAPGGLLGGLFRIVRETFNDKGGVVFEGPMQVDGANAETFWRVEPASGLAILVSKQGAPGFTNGGWWGWLSYTGAATANLDLTTFYESLRSASIEHKQIDGDALKIAAGGPITNPAVAFLDDSPHGVAQVGLELAGPFPAFPPPPPGPITGGYGNRSMPEGSRGEILITAHFKEKPGSGDPANNVSQARLSYAVQGSAWTAASTTAYQNAVTANGASNATGVVRYVMPGGAVPAGLRKPFDLSVAIQRDGSLGTSTTPIVLTGIGIDVAVVESTIVGFAREGVSAVDSAVDNMPWKHEVCGASESVAWHLTQPVNEGVKCAIEERGEIDAPLPAFEEVSAAIIESWFASPWPQTERVRAGIRESWVLSP